MHLTLRIFRYKPGWPHARYDTFNLDLPDQATVLEALQTVRRDHARDLVFRHSCHHASCGTCGVRVNGVERLACITRLTDLGTDTVIVEPLANFPVLADLAVDWRGFHGRFHAMRFPLVHQQGGEQIFERCITCGLCLSACPTVARRPSFFGPAVLAAAHRVLEEPRGARPAVAYRLAQDTEGVWACRGILACSAVCPLDVDPAARLLGLRAALARGRVSPSMLQETALPNGS